MAIFEVTKSYKGGQKIFYIELDRGVIPSEEMLEAIGDNTEGGQRYGYRMDYRKIRKLPKDAQLLPRTIKTRLY